MTDSAKNERARAAERLADGERLDWERLAADGSLPAGELRALRVIEAARLGLPGPSLELGFEILGELGKGSMGRVYRALDRSLRREVALKIMAPGKGSGQAAFVEEARLLASVRHPSVVQVYSIHAQDGEVRMALELIEGRTLAEIVQTGGPLSCSEAAAIGMELCRALACLHERGMIHRDLKPANVMREKGGRIVLLDFGIARSPGSYAALANHGAGTPRFMAPEQFSHEPAGPWTDLWSLGALLYWLVSGRFPFDGASYEELARSVGATRARALVDHRADADPRFSALIARALELYQRDRFQTAGDFEGELRALAKPVRPAGAEQAIQVSGRPPRRKALAFALAVLGLATMATWIGLRGPTGGMLFEAELFARRQGQDVRLQTGDWITAGELLTLEVSAARGFHLYVLDEDDAGDMHLLFPVPGFESQNPLAGEAAHRLPGKRLGEDQYWVVTSDGGAENLLIVASVEPMRAMDDLLATVPPVEPGEAPRYPAVPPGTRTALLRGIGQTAPESENPEAKVAAGGAGTLVTFVSRLETTADRAVRLVRLNHRR